MYNTIPGRFKNMIHHQVLVLVNSRDSHVTAASHFNSALNTDPGIPQPGTVDFPTMRIPSSFILSVSLICLTVIVVETVPVKRSKRTILQMCGLIRFYTNRSCLEYNNYGCFCGLGNAGRKPLDTIDACCWRHDYCYGLVDCFWMYPQWVGYNIQCDESGCQCTDSMESSPCARTTCECDVRFASCLTEGQFHDHYSNYDRVLCAQQPWQEHTEDDNVDDEAVSTTATMMSQQGETTTETQHQSVPTSSERYQTGSMSEIYDNNSRSRLEGQVGNVSDTENNNARSRLEAQTRNVSDTEDNNSRSRLEAQTRNVSDTENNNSRSRLEGQAGNVSDTEDNSRSRMEAQKRNVSDMEDNNSWSRLEEQRGNVSDTENHNARSRLEEQTRNVSDIEDNSSRSRLEEQSRNVSPSDDNNLRSRLEGQRENISDTEDTEDNSRSQLEEHTGNISEIRDVNSPPEQRRGNESESYDNNSRWWLGGNVLEVNQTDPQFENQFESAPENNSRTMAVERTRTESEENSFQVNEQMRTVSEGNEDNIP